MPLRLGENGQQVSTTTGTGTLVLSPNASGSKERDIAVALGLGTGESAKIPYFAFINDQFETGIGTVTEGTNDILERDEVKQSSNSNNLVDFPAGDKIVMICLAGWVFERIINIENPIVQTERATTSSVLTTVNTVFEDMGLSASITPTFPDAIIRARATIGRGEAIRQSGSPQTRQAEVRIRNDTDAQDSDEITFGDHYPDSLSSDDRSIHGGLIIEHDFQLSGSGTKTFQLQFRTTDANVQVRIARLTTLTLEELT